MNAVTKLSSTPVTFMLPRAFTLDSVRYMPTLDDALCVVRDIATGAIRQLFASKLYLYEVGNCDSFMIAYENGTAKKGQ